MQDPKEIQRSVKTIKRTEKSGFYTRVLCPASITAVVNIDLIRDRQ